jgi:tetratricopeptide (TPR) repeat protein
MENKEESKAKNNLGVLSNSKTANFALTLYPFEQTPINPEHEPKAHYDYVANRVTVNADGSVVERNHRGQVIRARYGNGNWAQFRFDASSELYAFVYARLAWSKLDKSIWSAQDSCNAYEIQGKITVDNDGTLRITKKDVTRCIKLDGSKIDYFINGTYLESYNLKQEAQPTDLLAETVPVWQQNSKKNTVEQVLVKSNLELGNETNDDTSTNNIVANKNPVVQERVQERQIDASQILKVSKELYMLTNDFIWQLYFALLYRIGSLSYLSLAHQLDKLADIHYQRRQMYKAARIHEQALSIRQQQLGKAHKDLAINFLGLAHIYRQEGKLAQAEDLYLKALALWDKQLKKTRFFSEVGILCRKKLAEEEMNLLNTIFGLVIVYKEKGDVDLSKQLFEQAMSIRKRLTAKQQAKLVPAIQEISYS